MNQNELDEFLLQQARGLARHSTRGVLGTIDEEGYPYTSLVEVIFEGGENFWLLLSDLAIHTKNIRRDVRASLWIGEDAEEREDLLASTRGAFQGRVIEMDVRRDKIEELYEEVHPHAKQFMNFKDFRFYRFQVERVRLIAGFGRIGWVEREDFIKDEFEEERDKE